MRRTRQTSSCRRLTRGFSARVGAARHPRELLIDAGRLLNSTLVLPELVGLVTDQFLSFVGRFLFPWETGNSSLFRFFSQLKRAFSARGATSPDADPINDSQVLERLPIAAISDAPEEEAHVG